MKTTGFFAQDSDRIEKLVTGVANPNFGLLVDIGNFACADDPSDKAVGRVAKYAKHVHAKDFHIKSGSEPTPGADSSAAEPGIICAAL